MTRQLTSDDRGAAVRDRRGPVRAAPYVLLALVAFLARLLPTLRGGGLSGLGVYDDAVYYSGAAALVAGRLPYADFVLLHPPGVVLALAPFAALGRLTSDPAGFAVARVAFMALGVLNTVLVARLARRFGPVAAVIAGLFYALWYPAAAAEARTMIEPLGTLVVLLCLVLLLPREGAPSRRATALAGVLLGVSLGLKIWAVAPVAVVVLWQLVVAGRAATARQRSGCRSCCWRPARWSAWWSPTRWDGPGWG
jgi:alpha-1,2-mannosyltransferase